MKKHISLLFLTALLGACSSKVPNLVHTQDPILNIEADASPRVQAQANPTSAWVKNVTEQAFNLAYQQFWYDKNGVTQIYDGFNESYSALIRLQPKQKVDIELKKPTPQSVNYRLYLYLQKNVNFTY